MNFKIRTYKKAGIEKGNLESELFYDTAEETLTKYKELFRREYLALNPTLWARSGNDKEWYRYSEPDFRKFFTGGRRKIDITECSPSVNCCNELVMNFEKGYVEALRMIQHGSISILTGIRMEQSQLFILLTVTKVMKNMNGN